MVAVAQSILEHGRSNEADKLMLPTKAIISMISQDACTPMMDTRRTLDASIATNEASTTLSTFTALPVQAPASAACLSPVAVEAGTAPLDQSHPMPTKGGG